MTMGPDGNADLYIDGTKTLTKEADTTAERERPWSTAGLFHFGMEMEANVATDGWSGNLDELAIWNRELSAQEIDDLYNNGNGISLAPPTQGSDRFTYKANDGALDSNTVTVSISVTPQNAGKDSDNDGLLDSAETNTGIFVDASDTGTDPNNPDSDGDGLLDRIETKTGIFVDANDTGTDPNNPDSDGDGFKDLVGDSNLDGKSDIIDLVAFSRVYGLQGDTSPMHDYNLDDEIDIMDLEVFTSVYDGNRGFTGESGASDVGISVTSMPKETTDLPGYTTWDYECYYDRW